MTHPPPGDEALGDIAPERFVAYGRDLVDWIGDYLAHAERYPVLSRSRPGEVAASLPPSPPARGESLAAILADFEGQIIPGVTHWNHPGFFAYFAITGSAPGILAELLTSALNVNAMVWRTSPAATELEERALDWLRQMLGMGDGWHGHINDTASISTMLALAAAREASGLDVRARGLAGRSDVPVLRVYCSEHAHSSVDRGAIAIGLGHDNVVKIATDAQFRMRPDALREAMASDVTRGLRPLAVVATVGTTSTTSIDPVRAVAEVARAHGAWVHVDGAYGGTAAIVPGLRHVLDGVEMADSLVVNPHKWLFVPIDCSALYTRRPDVLKRAFALVPEYLTSPGQDDVTNLMDYGVQLGRRFRALKLWMVIRAFGSDGLAARIAHHCALAREFASWVSNEPGWEVVAPVPFSLVCFRWIGTGDDDAGQDATNAAILEKVNDSGQVFLSHTKLGGRYVLRLAIGNLRTERRHVAGAWDLLREAASVQRG